MFPLCLSAQDNDNSQELPQAVEIKPESNTKSTLNEQEQASTANESPNDPSISVPIVVTPLEKADKSNDTEKTRQETTETNVSWWKLTLADTLTILFMAAVATFTYRLWRSTEKLWEASSNQIFTMNQGNQFTRMAAEAANQSAQAAADTVNSMNDTAERQLRAYISIKESGRMPNNINPELPAFKVIFKNSGQTPAYKVTS